MSVIISFYTGSRRDGFGRSTHAILRMVLVVLAEPSRNTRTRQQS